MRTFATLSLTCCLVVVIVLQAMTLRNQQPRESVVRFRPANEPMPIIETAAYSVDVAETEPVVDLPDSSEEFATTAENETPEPLVEDPAFASPAPVPSLVPLESASASRLGGQPEGNSDDPLAFAEPRSDAPPVLTGPVSPPKTANTLSVQPDQEQEPEQPELAAELAQYPIWLLIQPDGVQFLQTEEEIATHFHSIPPNSFLLGCQSASFEAGPAEESLLGESGQTSPARAFRLKCEDFVLKGSYGTKQQLEVTGNSLDYSTESEQILLKGTEESSLEYLSVDESASTRMQADQIVLQLHSDRFQVSAKGASGVEIEPNPDPSEQRKPKPGPPGFDPFPEGV
jgi:hypothetical protein